MSRVKEKQIRYKSQFIEFSAISFEFCALIIGSKCCISLYFVFYCCCFFDRVSAVCFFFSPRINVCLLCAGLAFRQSIELQLRNIAKQG